MHMQLNERFLRFKVNSLFAVSFDAIKKSDSREEKKEHEKQTSTNFYFVKDLMDHCC